MSPEALQKLKEKLTAIDNAVTIEELKKAVEAMLQFSVKLQTKTETELTSIKTAVDFAISRIQTLAKEESTEAKKELQDSCDSMMSDMRFQCESMISEAQQKIDTVKSGEDGKDGMDADEEKIIAEVLARIPKDPEETPEEVRDLLETIEVEDEKLKISAIGHLEEELKKLRKQISELSSRPMGGVATRDIVKSMDISAQLDGVTKTFQTSAMYRVITVLLSSTPSALRENVDYVWSDTSITFTSEINASTSLASGQSAIILYTSL